ncbi:MAG: FapA family protein [Clostridia bacterium]
MFNDRLQKVSNILDDEEQKASVPAEPTAEDSSDEPVVAFFKKNVVTETQKTATPNVDVAKKLSAYKERAEEAVRKKIKSDALTITVSPDKMTATLRISSKFDKSYPFTKVEVWEHIMKSRVDHGLSETFIDEFISSPLYDEDIVIAQGTDLRDGVDGYFIANFDYSKKGSFNADASVAESNEKIDFKDTIITSLIAVKGEHLGTIVPHIPSIDGFDVFGKASRARPAIPVQITFGENVFIDEENRVMCTSGGEIKWTNDSLSVSEIMYVENVNIETGNIRFGGSVVVEGDVSETFSVTCNGDIHVKGQVVSANLTAGGKITVDGGIHGRRVASCVVVAKGDVTAKFIEQSSVDCYGDVTAEEIINCKITARGNVSVLQGSGKLIGGECISCGNIYASTIGNPANVLTKVTLIGNRSLHTECNKLREDIKTQTLRISKIWESSKIQLYRTRSHVHRDAITEKTKVDVARAEAELSTMKEFFEKLENLIKRLDDNNEAVALIQAYENCRFAIYGAEYFTTSVHEYAKFTQFFNPLTEQPEVRFSQLN